LVALIRGTEVLVEIARSWRVIGALSDGPALHDGHEVVDLHEPRLVRVLSRQAPGHGIGIDEKGRRCTIVASKRVDLEPGLRIAVMPIDVKPEGRTRLVAQAISSCLPSAS